MFRTIFTLTLFYSTTVSTGIPFNSRTVFQATQDGVISLVEFFDDGVNYGQCIHESIQGKSLHVTYEESNGEIRAMNAEEGQMDALSATKQCRALAAQQQQSQQLPPLEGRSGQPVEEAFGSSDPKKAYESAIGLIQQQELFLQQVKQRQQVLLQRRLDHRNSSPLLQGRQNPALGFAMFVPPILYMKPTTSTTTEKSGWVLTNTNTGGSIRFPKPFISIG